VKVPFKEEPRGGIFKAMKNYIAFLKNRSINNCKLQKINCCKQP
jgi:hypothetical protein